MKKEHNSKKIDRQWLICISLGVIVLAIVAILIVFSNQNEQPKSDPTVVTNASSENDDDLTLTPLDENSEIGTTVKKVAENYLDTFISCDFDAIKSQIDEGDAPFFNFESESQMEFYRAIFPEISYEIDSLWENDGVYGAKVKITAPSMAEAIGDIHVKQIDSVIDKEESDVLSSQQIADYIISSLKGGTLSKDEFDVYVIVLEENGNYIPRCNEYVVNALLGGYPAASEELSATLSETMQALGE